MKKTYKRLLILGAAVSVTLLTACSSRSSAPLESYAETTAAATEDVKFDTYESYETQYDAETEGSSDSGELKSESGGTTTLPASRKLIRTIDMTAETYEFDKLVVSVQAKITALGGYIEQANISGTSLTFQNEQAPKYASIVARIPLNSLDSFVQTVENDSNVTRKTEATRDVTLQYSDTESRKKSLQVEQERVWAILEKADTLEAVITLEQRLSEIRYELEALESQLRLYDNQVDYSTVNLEISEVKDYTPMAPAAPESYWTQMQKGFTQNAHRTAGFFTSLFMGIITGLPIWLPILLILLLGYIMARKHVNREMIEEFMKQTPISKKDSSENDDDPKTKL